MTFLSTLWGLKEDTASSRHGFSCQFNDETYLSSASINVT